jgi:hypothetical protein
MIGDLENDEAESAAAAKDEGPDTDDKDGLLKTAKSWFKGDREHSADWRRTAKEDFDFANLRQWSEEDKRILREQMRPEITFDKVGTTIRTIIGIEIGNRREVRFIPRSQGDAKPDEVLTAAAEWARDACDAEDEESDGFRDTCICGMGWVDTRMDYESEPEGMIRQERVDPMEMYWDAAARKPNLADARRTWRVKTMPIEDARLLAPDAEDEELDAAWARDESEKKEPHNADPSVAYQQDGSDDGGKDAKEDVTLVHLQYWEREPYYRVSMGNGIESVSEADWPKFKKRADTLTAAGVLPPVKVVRQVRKIYKQALIGAKVLSMGPAACEGHFSWECITGERDQNEGVWYGVVRSMKDPQRWANKWLSQSLHILNTNAKGGLFAERGAFDNDRDAEDSYARSDRITWLKAGAIAGNRIQQKTPPQLPQNLADLMAYALSSIRDASGVNLELAGLQEQDQSGVLAEHRKQSGMTILAALFDSLRRYRKRQGRIMLYFITEYISDGRLIRIVGDEGAQYVPLIRQPGLVEYDVVVDDDPTSTNQKEKVWATLMQMMPFLADKLEPSDLAVLFEYSPLPQSVVDTWKQKIEQNEQQQAPIQQQMQQLQMALLETKAMLQSAQAQKAQADAAKSAAEAGAAGGGDAAAQTQLEYEKIMQDGQIKAGKAQSDAEIAAAKATSAHVLAQQKLDNEHAIAQAKLLTDVADKQAQRKADLVTEAGWMQTDAATKAHTAVISAAGKVQAAKVTAAHRPKGPSGGRGR